MPGSSCIMSSPTFQKSFSPLDITNHFFPDVTTTKRAKHFSTGCDTNENPTSYDYVMKVILLGDQGVGKTSFLKALKVHPDVNKVKCRCRLSQASDHLEVEVFTTMGKAALVRLCDTGGQERYRSLTSSYYRGAHGVLLMFDANNVRSLENIELWLSDLDSFTMASGCSRVLLGNHCASPERTVTSQAARKYADSRGLPYMECDSAQFYNVIEGIQLVVDRIAKEVTINPSSSSVIKPSLKNQ
ncbi:GTP-binding protein ypt1, partial [Aplysia californica]|uniref:GTP-binding protein ypt1 n=1 Tax=Aplysia californica TaxID=6500 RepID=A0ABM1AFL8_APLCA